MYSIISSLHGQMSLILVIHLVFTILMGLVLSIFI